MYVDLVGSMKTSMTLLVDKLVTIMRAFSHEVTSVIQSRGAYILKNGGDGVTAFFLSSSDRIVALQNSVKCTRSILSLIKNGINLISNQYDYHEFIVRLSIDEGENVIVLYGQDKSSSIQRHALP